jgi:hypothetical protein
MKKFFSLSLYPLPDFKFSLSDLSPREFKGDLIRRTKLLPAVQGKVNGEQEQQYLDISQHTGP